VGLAIIFGVKRFHSYLLGRKFVILSDHKPLRYLFKEDKSTPVMASACIQRWALTLGSYDYSIEYKPGDHHSNADCLSRLPLPNTPEEVPVAPEIVALINTLNSTPVTAAVIKQWTAKDPTLSKVLDLILHGGSSPDELVASYLKLREELSVQDGCVLSGNRVIRNS